MNNPEYDLNTLIELQSPEDIMRAVLQLSRDSGGKVMVKLTSLDDPDYSIWFHPHTAQTEADDPQNHGNIRYKFQTDIEQGNLRITEIVPLEVDENNPLGWRDALKKFGNSKGYRQHDFTYEGKLEKNLENR